ncbi:MAG: hypothetical protein ABWK02_03185 [Aquificaceae bacterium]
MRRYILIPILLSFGCGIKANPEVLKEPEVVIKRIGHKVYVKSLFGEIRVKGFERVEDHWIKENKEAFCFLIERVGGKSHKFCVEEAIEERPLLKVKEEKDYVEIVASGFEGYRLYPTDKGRINFQMAKDFKDGLSLERDYWERCYAITGVRASLESSPVEFCVKPKPPPVVKEVEGLEVRVGEGKLYLVWFYREDYREFVVYENGKEMGRTSGFAFEAPLPKERTIFTVKVISPLGFESKGVSVDYSP